MEERVISKSEADKNGTVKIVSLVVCERCGGSGIYKYTSMGELVNGTCFKCNGTGNTMKKYKKYTKEYREKLDKANEKRREKKRLETLKKEHDLIVKKYGEIDSAIYRYVGEDSFSKKGVLKENGARYEGNLGWYFNDEVEGFDLEKTLVSEFVVLNKEGFYRVDFDKWLHGQIAKEKEKREFIGEVNSTVSLRVTLRRINSFENHWGVTSVYTFEDEKGNVLVWKTGKVLDEEWSVGENKDVKFIVKEHGYYANKKQTYIKNVRYKKNIEKENTRNG